MILPPPPGLYSDVDDDEYHSDTGSLSSSGARTILMRSPAEFWYEQQHGRPPKAAYDEGHAAHLYLLGKGPAVEVIDAEDWRTDDARKARDAAYKAGKVPLLPHQDLAAREMAATVRRHELAGPLFAAGQPEMSGWWPDDETGVMLRLRTDWLTAIRGRLVIVDYKTSKSAGRGAFAKAAADYGYFMQHPYYTAGFRALEIADNPAFVFVTQCKTPPYRVTVAQLHPNDVALGHDLNRAAIRTYADCLAAGHWPDDSDRIHTVSIPAYARYRAQELLA
ncbi:PD-(D/E)XK nuclease-like domain-containing protein [Nocardia sp. CA-290969]|uniref:PD-(D/E)XK nuclease-like domain-containing protein n=1 Tax=Nocardia sp. CA-290969 TaxID=3239986 RepID=UPI003D916B86